MSLILDALRKMELERKAKRQGSTELRAEVLNYHGTPLSAGKPRWQPVLAALLLIFAAAALFFYFRTSGPLPEGAVKTAVPLPTETAAPRNVPPTDSQPVPAGAATPPAFVGTTPEPIKPAAVTEEASSPAGDSGIEVSGIAWQDERALRRAVINGALLGEGAEISGARIIEIRENLVRFNRNGRIFEVTNVSGTGR